MQGKQNPAIVIVAIVVIVVAVVLIGWQMRPKPVVVDQSAIPSQPTGKAKQSLY